MFMTSSASELSLPPELSTREHSQWRLFESVGHGFFIAVLHFRGDDPDARRTAMVCWDSDLVHLIEAPNLAATLHSLHHVVPPKGAEHDPVAFREVFEIWRGTDDEAVGSEVIIFKTVDGSAFCGQESIPIPPSVHEVELIARIGTADSL